MPKGSAAPWILGGGLALVGLVLLGTSPAEAATPRSRPRAKDPTRAFLEALLARGVTVVDARQVLARNPSKHYRKRKMVDTQGMVVHHNANQGAYGLRAIQGDARYHVQHRGWPGLGYLGEISSRGVFYLGNDIDRVTFAHGWKDHPGDENRDFVAVALQGLFRSPYHEGDEPTAAQVTTLMKVWMAARDLWHWSPRALYGHHQLGKPADPGTTLRRIVEAIQSGMSPEALLAQLGSRA